MDVSDAALLQTCAEKAVLQGESCHNEPFKVGDWVAVSCCVHMDCCRGSSSGSWSELHACTAGRAKA